MDPQVKIVYALMINHRLPRVIVNPEFVVRCLDLSADLFAAERTAAGMVQGLIERAINENEKR